ncbi:family 43 glycosylhydrolase [Streptomyces sp. NPDC096205]|uniref:family 43 glycosylhydrolase n=1 Tax=Streptomyces sp. NPDC096205 TaxID=3366081 RepID=UPI003808D24A
MGGVRHGSSVIRCRTELPLQKAGHGNQVQAGDDEWYLAYLVARPLGRRGPCVLGRETALAPVTWTPDRWPRTPTGLPATEVPAPAMLPAAGRDMPAEDGADGFDAPVRGCLAAVGRSGGATE